MGTNQHNPNQQANQGEFKFSDRDIGEELVNADDFPKRVRKNPVHNKRELDNPARGENQFGMID